MKKRFLTGASWIRHAYDQAVTEGLVDPHKVSFLDFALMSEQEDLDLQNSRGYTEEEAEMSKREIAAQFGGRKETVL